MKHYGFRHKILMLAVALVFVTQLVMLVPVLDLISRDSDAQADRTVGLAGTVFEQYMRNRSDNQLTNVGLIASDYPFRTVVTAGDEATIRSVLRNHAGRVKASVAAVLNLDGTVKVGATVDERPVPAFPAEEFAAIEDGTRHSLMDIGGIPYQTVTVPVKAPDTRAYVMLGFAIDYSLAAQLKDLTGLDVSFLSSSGIEPRVLTSTLPTEVRHSALAGLDPQRTDAQRTGTGADAHVSLVRPFTEDSNGVYVVMQLSQSVAAASYRRVRNFLYAITGLSLLLAISGSFWLARTVTRPVHDLAEAARRMREGVYNEPINIRTSDEFGELAGSFNAMQQAIADRERRIVHQAHHDSLSGLPNREAVVAHLRDAIERHDKLAVVSLGLDRINGIVSSRGHRAAQPAPRYRGARPLERSRVRRRPAGARRARSRRVDRVPGRRAACRRARVEREHLAASHGRRRLLSRAQRGRRGAVPPRFERAQRGARAPSDGSHLPLGAGRPLAAADQDRRRPSARVARRRAAALHAAEARPHDGGDLRRRGARSL